jgi:hypothetical protein
MNNFLRTIARVALGQSYVFQPMASRYRSKKIVKCPETDEPAEILVDASPATTLRAKRKLLSIRNCSLWPTRKGCTQGCLK